MATPVESLDYETAHAAAANVPEVRERDRINRVFVVDDNDSQLTTLAALLEDEGFTVATSGEPHEALERIARGGFGVAVVDLRMPGLTGIQVLEAIKGLARLTHVIIHTAHGDFDSARQAVNLGAFAFVEKLGDPGDLLAHVHRASHDLLQRYNDELESKAQAQSVQLFMSERRAQTTLDSIAESVITTDAEGLVDYMNPVAEALTGWSTERARGKTFCEVFRLIDGATRETLTDPARRCIELGRTITPSRSTILLSRTGQEHWITGSAAPLLDARAKVVGAVIAATDITALVRVQHELRIHQDRLEELVDARTAALTASMKELDAFSASVSHDLRTPLRSIDGFSKILLDDYHDRLDDGGRDALRRVRAASQHMGKLIDDLLKLSRLSRRDVSRERVDMTGLARDIARDLTEDHPQRQIEFEVAEGLYVLGDTRLLQVALDNLLGNAVKYTAMEKVARISCTAERSKESPKLWVFCIRDNGVGFDMQYASKLFGAFQRLHNQDEFEGTGIGLATTARIIERHGGRIWADGRPDEGASFFFTLPAADA